MDALERPGVGVPAPPHATYIDDCTVGAEVSGEGDCEGDWGLILRAWGATLAAMLRLAFHGLPINLRKCGLLQKSLSLLGVVLFEQKYSLGRKSWGRLIAGELP